MKLKDVVKKEHKVMEQLSHLPFGSILTFISSKDILKTREYAIGSKGRLFLIKNFNERGNLYYGDITSEIVDTDTISNISLLSNSIKIGDKVEHPIQLDAMPIGSTVEVIMPELLRQDPSTHYIKIGKQWRGDKSIKKVPSRGFEDILRRYELRWVK